MPAARAKVAPGRSGESGHLSRKYRAVHWSDSELSTDQSIPLPVVFFYPRVPTQVLNVFKKV